MQSPVVAIAVAAFDVVTSAAVLLPPEEEMDLAVGAVTAAEEACAVTSPAGDSGVLAAVVSTFSSDYPLLL